VLPIPRLSTFQFFASPKAIQAGRLSAKPSADLTRLQ